MTLTFNQELLLMVIDKAVIALLVLGFVYFGQKKLESYKARQVFWAETAKERLRHIAREWSEMNKWDCMVGDTLHEIVQIMVDRSPQLVTNLSAHGVRPELSEMSKVLSQAPAGELRTLLQAPPENLSRAIEASVAQGRVVDNALQVNRFWLGQELYASCREFQKVLSKVCIAVVTVDLNTLTEQIPEIEKKRKDVLSVLELIK